MKTKTSSQNAVRTMNDWFNVAETFVVRVSILVLLIIGAYRIIFGR